MPTAPTPQAPTSLPPPPSSATASSAVSSSSSATATPRAAHQPTPLTIPELLIILIPLYLTDYGLTLAASGHHGFHELNPITGTLWNTGDVLTPLLLKLTGCALLLLAPRLLGNAPYNRAFTTGLQLAIILFAGVNAYSILRLTA